MENVLHARQYGAAGSRSRSVTTEGTVMAINTNSTQSPVRPTLQLPRPSLPSHSAIESNPRKRARKDRGPNWLPQEVTALVNAKRDMFLEEIDIVDGRDLMHPDSTKWLRISQEVMKVGFSPCVRDAAACKTKWNQIVPEYKRIADFFARTGRNEADYWDMTTIDRKNEGLPRSFPRDVFYNIHDWYGQRPTMQPPHTRDLLSHDDGNYEVGRAHTTENNDVGDSEPEAEDPVINIAEEVNDTDDTDTHTSLPAQGVSNSTTSGAGAACVPNGARSVRVKSVLPAGVMPQLISSSDTSDSNGRRRMGNTAVRRKSLSGHSLIAEATKASGDIMANQMREMAEASRDLERSKIEVQLKIFTEQMEYQREKDRRLHESSCIANANARLAIEKQGEVVQCLAQLSSVLSVGLHLPDRKALGTQPHTSPPVLIGQQTVPNEGPSVIHLPSSDNNTTTATTTTLAQCANSTTHT